MRRPVLAVLAVAAAVRAASLILELQLPYLRHPILDAAYYDEAGRAIASGDLALGREVFHMSPLYSYVVGGVYAATGGQAWAVVVLQALLGVGTVALIHAAARRLLGAGGWSLAAGLAAALYGPFVFYEAQLLAESIATFLVALVVLLTLRAASPCEKAGRRWAAVGAALGAATLARPSLLLAAVPLAAVALASRPRARAAAGLLVATALVIAPVTLRNLAVAGEPVLITDSGGLNFFIGNGRGAIGTFRVPRSVPAATRVQTQFAAFRAVAEERAGHPLDARGADAFWYQQAFRRIQSDTSGWLALMGDKLLLYWNGRELPNNESYDFHRLLNRVLALPLVPFALLSPLALLGTLLWLARGRREERLVAGLNVALCAGVVAFFVVGRYRLPAVPPLLLAGAGAARSLVDAAAARRWRALVPGAAALALFAFVALIPRFPKPFDQEWFNLALAYHLDGDLGRAEEAYREALALAPGSLKARRNLALLLDGQGRRDEARAQWQALAEHAERAGDAAQAADARLHLLQ